jgi:regulator of ribonuclease activity A
MNIQTADLCDAHEDKLAVVAPMFASYGGRPPSAGRSRR